jgi:hypothetical protein
MSSLFLGAPAVSPERPRQSRNCAVLFLFFSLICVQRKPGKAPAQKRCLWLSSSLAESNLERGAGNQHAEKRDGKKQAQQTTSKKDESNVLNIE